METDRLVSDICQYIDRKATGADAATTDIPGFAVFRSNAPTKIDGQIYQPVVCLILQGRKEAYIGDRYLDFGAGQSLIASHDMPVMARITHASRQKPYVAMVMELDLGIVRSLYEEVGETDLETVDARALDTGETSDDLVQAMARLFALSERKVEARVMAPLIRREIHFRLLLASHGGMLRQFLKRESHANRIAKAIARIRQDYSANLSVGELAGIAGMSASSFHEHFKALTATSPLQYQKDLRLIEARRLLREAGYSVSRAAFDVGYESPTQFSREYSRKFGMSPRRDLSSIAG